MLDCPRPCFDDLPSGTDEHLAVDWISLSSFCVNCDESNLVAMDSKMFVHGIMNLTLIRTP